MEENTDNKVIIPLREQDKIFYEHLAEDIEKVIGEGFKIYMQGPTDDELSEKFNLVIERL
jgi:hypothetical protein